MFFSCFIKISLSLDYPPLKLTGPAPLPDIKISKIVFMKTQLIV